MQKESTEVIFVTPEQLRAIVIKAVAEALVIEDRRKTIECILLDEEGMRNEIAAAEAAETKGKHSMLAGWMVDRLDRIRPANPTFECQREELPARVPDIVAEARRHLQVDLSAFLPPQPPHRAHSDRLRTTTATPAEPLGPRKPVTKKTGH